MTWDIVIIHVTYVYSHYHKTSSMNTKSWIDHDVKLQIKSKHTHFNKYYRKPTAANWKAYTIERNISTTVSDNARVRLESIICRDSQQNPKTCRQYVNSKHKKVNKLLRLRDLSKANFLNKYFSSFFTKDEYTDDVLNNDVGNGSFYFNENHLKTLIEKLNICKASGPDIIHAKVINECKLNGGENTTTMEGSKCLSTLQKR